MYGCTQQLRLVVVVVQWNGGRKENDDDDTTIGIRNAYASDCRGSSNVNMRRNIQNMIGSVSADSSSRFLVSIGFDAVLSYGFARRDISAWSLLPSTTNRLFVSKYIPMYWYIGTYSYNIYILHEGIGVYFSRISVCCHKKNRANDISLPFTPSYTKLPVRCFSLPS